MLKPWNIMAANIVTKNESGIFTKIIKFINTAFDIKSSTI